jgi:glucokinase
VSRTPHAAPAAIAALERAVAAVDWGGTWIRIAIATTDGRLLVQARQRRPADLGEQCALVAERVARLAAGLDVRPSAVGVGIAGITRGGVVESAVNIGITEPYDLTQHLKSGLGLPVIVVNDTQAAAVAEARDLGHGTSVLLTVGTGIGGAIVTAGRLTLGSGAAGDFGHMVVILDGPQCPCGGRGCLEQLASGRVLDLAARRLAETGASPWLATRAAAQNELHAGDLDSAAQEGDGEARAVLAEAASALVAGLHSITAAIDPEVIVLGGGLIGPESLLTRLVNERWREQRPHWSAAVLRPALLGADAGLRGAALLAAQMGIPPVTRPGGPRLTRTRWPSCICCGHSRRHSRRRRPAQPQSPGPAHAQPCRRH